MFCVSAGTLVAAGGGKDSSGTIDVDDKVKDLGMQLKRGKREQERCTIRATAGLFLEPCAATLTRLPSSSTPNPVRSVSTSPFCVVAYNGQGISNNKRVIPLHNTPQTRRNKTV